MKTSKAQKPQNDLSHISGCFSLRNLANGQKHAQVTLVFPVGVPSLPYVRIRVM